jgi:hypothetical protein
VDRRSTSRTVLPATLSGTLVESAKPGAQAGCGAAYQLACHAAWTGREKAAASMAAPRERMSVMMAHVWDKAMVYHSIPAW